MTIDRLNSVNPLENINSASKVKGAKAVAPKEDSISISDEAREMSEIYYMNEVAKITPDVRAEKIAALKEKIKDPNYLNAATIEMTADRILSSIGL
ncbi:MAG: flagellar biosynthesis anti-sigma factor FlgM [Treponemataceae bacterium]|nr:flagellar biosynthesis anti-sigma factor FlgM [Treponemataceae bacterium]